MPKPGRFVHGLTDQFRFSSTKVGRLHGSIEAEMDEFPPDGDKYYIKLLLKYLGTEGGLVFGNGDDDGEDNQVLDFQIKMI